MITLDTVYTALHLTDFDPEEAQAPMMPGTRQTLARRNGRTRQAGVLVLLFPCQQELHFVLTRRTDTLRGHSGQVSFPGGKRDADDATFVETAQRETFEELGVRPENMVTLGSLSTLFIPPTNFEVYPTVAALDEPPQFHPNPSEVAEVFTVPLDYLLDDHYKQAEYRDFQGHSVWIPYYAFHGHKVWGATAMMLSEFENRLRAALL